MLLAAELLLAWVVRGVFGVLAELLLAGIVFFSLHPVRVPG